MRLLLLSSLFGLAAATCQASHVETSRIYIPHDFVANGVEFKAGNYLVQATPSTIRISRQDDQASVLIPVAGNRFVTAPRSTRVVLRRDGSRLRLAGIRVNGSGLLRVVNPDH